MQPGYNNIYFKYIYLLKLIYLTPIQCVLQWRYVAGNNWGKCPNGTEKVGCGPQEHFFGKLFEQILIT